MDLNNILCSCILFLFWEGACRLFDLGCPLSVTGWGSLNKAHTSQDACWDAFWRTFGLPRPQTTKEALCKHTHRRRLQSHTTYTEGGSWDTEEAAGPGVRSPRPRKMAPMASTPSPKSRCVPSEEVCSVTRAHTTTPLVARGWHGYRWTSDAQAWGYKRSAVLALSPRRTLSKSRIGLGTLAQVGTGVFQSQLSTQVLEHLGVPWGSRKLSNSKYNFQSTQVMPGSDAKTEKYGTNRMFPFPDGP